MEFQFDDVDGMNAAASDEYGAWGPEIEVTQDMINGFAELTGDRQWIHGDHQPAQGKKWHGVKGKHGPESRARRNKPGQKSQGHPGNPRGYQRG